MKPKDSVGRTSRASMLGTIALGTFLAATGGASKAVQAASAITDADILNFALNLEYLEAEFYNYSVYGHGIEARGVPVTGVGSRGRA